MNSMAISAVFLLVWFIWVCFFCYGTHGASCNQAEREALLSFKADLLGLMAAKIVASGMALYVTKLLAMSLSSTCNARILGSRADLQDPSGRLSSWVKGSKDCCKWSGVACDNVTGHVTKLRLPCPHACFKSSKLTGKLNPSLLELKHLTYLDLSKNDFQVIPIPRFLGSMESMDSLLLDESRFGGVIPHQLGNLSNLLQLGLKASVDDYVLYADSLQWLSGLPALEYLDLSDVDLSNASDWLTMINVVPNLSELHLSNCQINGNFALEHVNLSSLSVLDLGFNRFGPTSFPSWVSHLKSLTSLNLRDNNLRGPVPVELRNLTSLRVLTLCNNMFNSSIPNWLFNFHHLEDLNFHYSYLGGEVPDGIGNLTSLVNLDLSFNFDLRIIFWINKADVRLEGGIPASFKRFCHLKSLDLSRIKLRQSVSEVLQILQECSSSTLERLSLGDCQLFGQLTDQISKFKRLKRLELNDNSISGPLPVSFGELTSLNYVNLASNQINGTIPASFGELADLEVADISQNLMEGVVSSEIHLANLTRLSIFRATGNQVVLKVKPDWVPPKQLAILDLSSWYIGPSFPKWLQSIQSILYLDLSNTGISEPIPDWFWSRHSQFYYLNFSHNQIPGQLPSFVPAQSFSILFDLSWNYLEAQVRDTKFLNLQGNLLSGEIPECWRSWPSLKVLRLGSNNLRGYIPETIGTLSSLLSLRIQNNYLTGEIPLSLGNCSTLVSIDVGDNELEGNIPKWIGEKLSKMAIINLRGNKLTGDIPEELCHLQLLQILDLSHNFLSGNLPECIANFSAMANPSNEDQGVIHLLFGGSEEFVEYQVLVAQGQVKTYSTILNYVRSIDLSWNNFSGEIPKQIASLVALHYLNLSHNSLSGSIPRELDAMASLESLDMSENQLSGAIPPGMASLTFLNHLNLSYNNLSGRIPSSTQLQSLEPSSFIGNKRLCGSPLNVSCSRTIPVPDSGEGKADHDLHWYSVSVMFGFGFGFWGIVGPLAVL
ncbi:Receptor-like protein EIX2 [Linum perenne]